MATAVIADKNKNITKRIENANYPITRIFGPRNQVVIEDILPFRIRITNIGIPSYSSTNIPGIGLQVIGYSNYIL